MRYLTSLALSLLFAAALVVAPLRAQPAVTCDSTLMLLVLLARLNYGYESSFELSQFETGQLQSLFDATNQQGASTSSGDTSETGPTGAQTGISTGGSVALDLSGAALSPGNIEGEPTECAQLRSEVELYLLSQLQNMPLGGSQATQEPTSEPTAEVGS